MVVLYPQRGGHREFIHTTPEEAEMVASERERPMGFEIEVLSEPCAEVAVPVPGGCNSSSNSSCSNDSAEQAEKPTVS